MRLSRRAIERPVFAAVVSLLLVVLGVGALLRLPVREYPDVDPPVVTVTTVWFGASAAVIDRDVTEPLEEALSSIEGIETLRSTSRDEVSRVEVEFVLTRDLDAAAADVRDKLGQVQAELPEDSEDPVVTKASGEADPILWLTITSRQRDRLELTDYADRHLVDPLSVVPGVAQVVIGGARRYAMRIWLDDEAMAAHGVTARDVARALRDNNLELPAGRLESEAREFTVRAMTRLAEPREFEDLILRQEGGVQVTLGDVAEVEVGAADYRSAVRIDGRPAIGLGVVRQSKANTLAVARGVSEALDRLRERVPEDVTVEEAFDASVFIEGSIEEVVETLAITGGLVVLVILAFLRSLRAVIVPAVTIPVSLVATFTALWAFGYTVNTLTLLALVLAIGLVVDDAIVVVENVHRHRAEGAPLLLAAARGAGQVGPAVIATTLALVAVFVPLTFLTGDIGRLFTEFGVALAASVSFSSVVALTLGASLSARLVRVRERASPGPIGRALERVRGGYRALLDRALTARPVLVAVVGLAASGLAYAAFRALPRELAPVEDRAQIVIPVQAPESATFDYTDAAVRAIEDLLRPMMGEGGPVERIISVIGLSPEGPGRADRGFVIVRLSAWDERERHQREVARELMPRLLALPEVQAFAVNPPSFGQEAFASPAQLVVGGPDFEAAARWGRRVLDRARELPGLSEVRIGYEETKAQLRVTVDRERAQDLGLGVRQIDETLQVLFSEQQVTEFIERARSYDVIPQAGAADRRHPQDLLDVTLRSRTSGELVPLRGVIRLEEVGAPAELVRVDRIPSVTISGSLAPDQALGEVLETLEAAARAALPQEARLSWLGRSKDYQESRAGFYIAFALALVFVYLVLAAQFESFLDPLSILLPVPLAVTGGLGALWLAGGSFNIFAQIALILLVGLMAKNSILVVEFVNQLRDEGRPLREAVVEASAIRLRPILMTSVATAFGALPLALASGPGAEGRRVIGIVVLGGIAVATLMALTLVPALATIAGRFTRPAGETARALEALEREEAAAP